MPYNRLNLQNGEVLNASHIDHIETALEEVADATDSLNTIPAGGTTGQVLMKSSDASYETEWGDYVSGYTKEEVDAMFAADSLSDVPTGGSTGQALVKSSGSDYDVEWKTMASYSEATTTTSGLMSSTDKSKLDGLSSIYVGDETTSNTTLLNADTLGGHPASDFYTTEQIDDKLADIDVSSQIQESLNGLKFVVLSQDEFDALTTKDSSTIYFIYEEA